jgi:hypothetical protein
VDTCDNSGDIRKDRIAVDGQSAHKKVEVEGKRMFLPRADYFDANLPGASQTVRIASFYDAKVFVRRWVIRDKDPVLKALLRDMGKVNSFAATDSAIRQLQQALASRGLLVMISPLLNALP